MKTNIFISLLILVTLTTQAQKQTVVMTASSWSVSAKKHRFIQYKGKSSLYLKDGAAFVKDITFTSGIIEFDVAFSSQRQFNGVYFRANPGKTLNAEHFYLRSHQTGKLDANQYTPVFNSLSGWQLYHGEAYGKPYQYKFDQWMHVKVVVVNRAAEFYIDDMDTPLFRTYALKHPNRSGLVGFNSGRGVGYFANLTVTKTDNPTLKGVAPKTTSPEAGTITEWQVSNVFKESKVAGKVKLDAEMKNGLSWKTLQTEFTGTANLARLSGINRKEKKNTVFARVVINSDKAQVKKITFGYSDRARVYCNNQLMYAGNNGYKSRDFRYLGTIGYFDTVYLPLKKGKNEVWFAISESFGGWGIKAKMSNMKGVKLE